MRFGLVSGKWPSKDENGLISMGDECRRRYSDSSSGIHHYKDSLENLKGYDVYISHSFGNQAVKDVLKKYPDMKVKAWILIDPVATGIDWFFPWNNFTIPKNVSRALCFRRNFPLLPPSSLILNEVLGVYDNIDGINMGHGSAPKNSMIVQKTFELLDSVLL